MPRYQWHDSPVIASADLKENLSYPFAILTARTDASPQALQALPAQLQRKGLVAIPLSEHSPDSEPGAAQFRVWKYDKPQDLLNTLQSLELVGNNPPQIRPLSEEQNPEVVGFREWLQKYSINLAGCFYLVADLATVGSGIARRTPSEVAQGGMWAATSLGLALFGRKNPNVQMGNIYQQMREFMAQEGIQLNEDQALTLRQLQRDPSYWNAMINFLYEHPVLFNNSLQGLGGVMQSKAGLHQGNHYKTTAGVAVAAGQWGGLLIPEDKYAGLSAEARAEKLKKEAIGEADENGFHTSIWQNPVAWVNEKPLRLTAIGPIIGNFLTAGSALFLDRHAVNEYFGQTSRKYELNPLQWLKDGQRSTSELLAQRGNNITKDMLKADSARPEWAQQHTELNAMLNRHIGWRFTMMTPVFNMIANTLYGMSSKEERSENLVEKGYVDENLSVAATIYATVPEAERESKIVRYAGFLKSQLDKHISRGAQITEQEICDKLHANIASLEKRGWTRKVANDAEPLQPAVGL